MPAHAWYPPPTRRAAMRSNGLLWCVGLLLMMPVIDGCVPGGTEGEVTIYSALDRDFAAPIVAAFHRAEEKKIQPLPVYDVESTKTVGLVRRIINESKRPGCDVFWNNEILHTVRLQKMGLLQKHDWNVPASHPASMIASDSTWCGFAARARVLIVNTKSLPNPDDWPRSVDDLADPKWKGRCAMARPLFGTTATHAAVLDSRLGERADAFFESVAKNARIVSGNKQVALAVSGGQIDWGITDTDDAIIEKDAG
ncbi:MAG: ABC transporter substrate-binding protein, partial [Planctomycetota bacterium]